MKSNLKWNYLSFFILLFILSQTFSSLKFKKDSNFVNGKNLPLSVKQSDIDKINKQSSQLALSESEKKELLLTPAQNFLDALVLNYKGKNVSRRSLNPEIKVSNDGINSNISSNAKATVTSNVNANSFQIPVNQNNLNLASSIQKNSGNKNLSNDKKSNSFIEIEDHNQFIENHNQFIENEHLMSNNEEDSISQLDINEFESDDIEELHLKTN